MLTEDFRTVQTRQNFGQRKSWSEDWKMPRSELGKPMPVGVLHFKSSLNAPVSSIFPLTIHCLENPRSVAGCQCASQWIALQFCTF